MGTKIRWNEMSRSESNENVGLIARGGSNDEKGREQYRLDFL